MSDTSPRPSGADPDPTDADQPGRSGEKAAPEPPAHAVLGAAVAGLRPTLRNDRDLVGPGRVGGGHGLVLPVVARVDRSVRAVALAGDAVLVPVEGGPVPG